mmetsp:Transcript_22720/g.71287  ORF Transcript_22720/g.71287 Transcript_22720/m.71287 type:complete len:243 (+) Transcript_22720:536-1264(+)
MRRTSGCSRGRRLAAARRALRADQRRASRHFGPSRAISDHLAGGADDWRGLRSLLLRRGPLPPGRGALSVRRDLDRGVAPRAHAAVAQAVPATHRRVAVLPRADRRRLAPLRRRLHRATPGLPARRVGYRDGAPAHVPGLGAARASRLLHDLPRHQGDQLGHPQSAQHGAQRRFCPLHRHLPRRARDGAAARGLRHIAHRLLRVYVLQAAGEVNCCALPNDDALDADTPPVAETLFEEGGVS